MSRCLPYTPSMKAVDREALLEPIKLQRDLEKKDKTHRKEGKKDKTQRRKEKKEKKERKEKERKEEEEKKRQVHKDDVLSTCAIIRGVDAKDTLQQEIESNLLEKSDITEEHELPILSENICYLSDGTQSSTKSKRTIIRIKSMPKRNDPQSSHASCAEPTSRSAVFPTDVEMKETVNAPSAETNVEFEKATSTSGQKVSTFEDHMEGLLHQSVIGNLVHPRCQSVLDDHGDEDWLFERKLENIHGSKRFKASNDVVSACTSQFLWPQAQWLPEPGLAALPFTVQF